MKTEVSLENYWNYLSVNENWIFFQHLYTPKLKIEIDITLTVAWISSFLEFRGHWIRCWHWFSTTWKLRPYTVEQKRENEKKKKCKPVHHGYRFFSLEGRWLLDSFLISVSLNAVRATVIVINEIVDVFVFPRDQWTISSFLKLPKGIY